MKNINLILEKYGWLIGVVLIIIGIFVSIQSALSFNESKIIIEWSTASELDTVGFNISRAKGEDGEKNIINKQLIPSSTDPLAGGDYSFEDEEVESGQIYYYWLDEIELTGNINTHGPIIQTAKNLSRLNLLLGVMLIGSGGFYLWFLKNPTHLRQLENE